MNNYTTETAATPAEPYKRKFLGTKNPRRLRALDALLAGPVSREALDKVTGVSNSPQLVSELRRLGLEVPCERQAVIDRDGKACHRGVYSLTNDDWLAIVMWQFPADGVNW